MKFIIYSILAFSFCQKINAESFDVVIYGGTSAGVIAGVQVARMGKTVAIIEPTNFLGGMTSSGLGWVDVSKPQTIGGLAREFFHHIWLHYQKDDAWTWEQKIFLKDQMNSLVAYQQTMWILEPHVAELIFERMITAAGVKVFRSESLNREIGVKKINNKIEQILMQSGRVFEAKMFIDASYEGDLLAAAGVSYRVGRESNALYGEYNNGMHPNFTRPDFPPKISPAGLPPTISVEKEVNEGAGDSKVQAYNYRMCLTDVVENAVRIEKPDDYNDQEYELLFRIIEATPHKFRYFKLDMMPNRKTDSNNYGPISTDYVGMSSNYAEASYEKRREIAKAHERWQRGLVWTLQNHPKIPEHIKTYCAPWGLAKDEFKDNNNWPHLLYVREARRMISDVVITEQIALGINSSQDSVGLGSYHMDSHVVSYAIAPDGFLATEGCLFIKVIGAFPISYQAIIPKACECQNLLVPVCVSATHVAFGAIRMEPIFMVLGQSAGTAAVLAIELEKSVQDLPYPLLAQRLIADGQKIEYDKK